MENLFESYNDINSLINYLFLLKKYKNICLKYIFDSKIEYSLYLVESKGNYNIYIANDDEDNYEINGFIEYSKKYIKIDKIIKKDLPFGWKDILKSNKKSKNSLQSKKCFGNKLNQKQILQYEFEEDEYLDEENNEYKNNKNDISDK